MQIFLTTRYGGEHPRIGTNGMKTLEVESTDTLWALKERVYDKFQIPPDLIQVTRFELRRDPRRVSTEMDLSHATLHDLGVEHHETLELYCDSSRRCHWSPTVKVQLTPAGAGAGYTIIALSGHDCEGGPGGHLITLPSEPAPGGRLPTCMTLFPLLLFSLSIIPPRGWIPQSQLLQRGLV